DEQPVHDLGWAAPESQVATGPRLLSTQAGQTLCARLEQGRILCRAWKGGSLGEARVSTEWPVPLAGASQDAPLPIQGWPADRSAPLEWCASEVRGADGTRHRVHDEYAAGDYDVVYEGPAGRVVVAGTRAREANPSIALDARGRVWIAWDVG